MVMMPTMMMMMMYENRNSNTKTIQNNAGTKTITTWTLVIEIIVFYSKICFSVKQHVITVKALIRKKYSKLALNTLSKLQRWKKVLKILDLSTLS